MGRTDKQQLRREECGDLEPAELRRKAEDRLRESAGRSAEVVSVRPIFPT